jgi:hypothetical protein
MGDIDVLPIRDSQRQVDTIQVCIVCRSTGCQDRILDNAIWKETIDIRLFDSPADIHAQGTGSRCGLG